MSWGTASGSKTLVKEMWASAVLKVTHCGGSWQHCLGGEGHVCVEAVGFVCCHLLLPSEFSQFESQGVLKDFKRGQRQSNPYPWQTLWETLLLPRAGLRPVQQLHAKAVMLSCCVGGIQSPGHLVLGQP